MKRLSSTCVMTLLVAFLIGTATAGPNFQGFEKDTGDWFFYDYGAVSDRVKSGKGTLRVTSASGRYHAELGNFHDAYASGLGSAGISYFGQSAPDPVYQGSFYQAVDVYIDPTWDGLGFWIDMSPSNVDGKSFYAAEGNFRLAADGSSVTVQAINSKIIATITTAGWYTFEICWSKGEKPTDLINIDLSVYDSTGTLHGSESFPAIFPPGMGGYTGASQYLGNSSYVWFTVWENNFAGDVIAIDNVRTGLKYPTLGGKDDCKKGGWQNFFRADNSTFINQGDCIQYVNKRGNLKDYGAYESRYDAQYSWTKGEPAAEESVVTGDLNNDGIDDLAGVTTSAKVIYSTNLTTWANINGNLQGIVTGDFNGDGNIDIAGLNSTGQIWYTTDLITWVNISGTFSAITKGDLDGDGDDDIVGINSDGVSSKAFYTTDLATFTSIPGVITSIVTGDLDGDGDDDIAGINPDGVTAKVFYTTDLSAWMPIPGLITSIITGDFDGDGDDDIAGINPDGMISKIFYTTDLSTWTPIPGLITSIVAGDFDGDGDDDIAGINPNGISAKIFYTNDLVNWNIIPGALEMITTGDLNADGRDDMAGINSSGMTWYTTDLATWTNIP